MCGRLRAHTRACARTREGNRGHPAGWVALGSLRGRNAFGKRGRKRGRAVRAQWYGTVTGEQQSGYSSPSTVVRFGNPGTTARSQSFRSSGRPSVRVPASFEEGISGAPFFAAEPEGAEPGVPEEPEKPAESKSDPPQEFSSDSLFCRAASSSSCFCLHRSMSPKNRNAPTAQTPAASQEYIAPTGMTDATKIAEMTVKIILSVFKKFPPCRVRRSFPIRSGLL